MTRYAGTDQYGQPLYDVDVLDAEELTADRLGQHVDSSRVEAS